MPSSTQVGWIADEVEAALPEIVSVDKEGYQAVAYSHSCVILAEAMKEMQRMHEQEMKALKESLLEELQQLRREMAGVKQLK